MFLSLDTGTIDLCFEYAWDQQINAPSSEKTQYLERIKSALFILRSKSSE